MGGGNTLPYDYEVEWIGTEGNVQFVTDFVPNTYDLTIRGCFYFGGYTDNSKWISWFQAYTGEDHSTYRIIRNSNSNDSIYLNNGTKANGGGNPVSVTIGKTYDFNFSPRDYIWEGSSKTHSSSGNVNTGRLSIFNYKFIGKMVGAFQVLKGNTLVLDLIPVVKGGVGYLFDRVANKLHAYSGTGTPTIGQIKQNSILPYGYTRVEYVKNTGNAFFDSWVTLNHTETISGRFKINQWSDQWQEIFGYYYSEQADCTRLIRNGNKNNILYADYDNRAKNGGGFSVSFPGLDQVFDFELADEYIVIDGVRTTRSTKSHGDSYNASIKILTAVNRALKAECYRFTVSGRCDYIPCKNPNGIVGMYDIIIRRFNAGINNSSLVAGPDV